MLGSFLSNAVGSNVTGLIDHPVSGDDVALSSSGAGVALNGAGVAISPTSPTLVSVDNASGEQTVAGDPGLLSTLLTGGSGQPAAGPDGAIHGTSGNDAISGTDAHEYIYGGAGSDTILGGNGNDHLYGFGPGGGADAGDRIDGGDGNDYIQGNAGNDTLFGGSGSDRIFGGADNDLAHGGIGDDQLHGAYGNDTLFGDEGNDTIQGGKGDDVLDGGAGADWIKGGLGSDVFTGGAGADTFVFSGNDAAIISVTALLAGAYDRITDFEDGSDHISIGWMPASVAHGSAGSLAAALVTANGLLALDPGGHEVAAITVGSSSYLFYSSADGLLADSAIALDGVTAEHIGTADFI